MNNKKNYKKMMTDAEIHTLYKKDKAAGNEKIVEKYSDYIYYMLKKYYPSYKKYTEDMYQNGCIGLMMALRSYNPEKGAFSTHCTPFIKKEIGKETRFLSGEKTEYYAALSTKINRAKTSLETEGKEATTQNVMEETGLSKKIVSREMNIDHTKVSYDVLSGTATYMKLSDELICNDILKCLPDETRRIVSMKVIEGLPFSEISRKLGKSYCNITTKYQHGIDILKRKMA